MIAFFNVGESSRVTSLIFGGYSRLAGGISEGTSLPLVVLRYCMYFRKPDGSKRESGVGLILPATVSPVLIIQESFSDRMIEY